MIVETNLEVISYKEESVSGSLFKGVLKYSKESHGRGVIGYTKKNQRSVSYAFGVHLSVDMGAVVFQNRTSINEAETLSVFPCPKPHCPDLFCIQNSHLVHIPNGLALEPHHWHNFSFLITKSYSSWLKQKVDKGGKFILWSGRKNCTTKS